MAEKYAKLVEKYAKPGKAAKYLVYVISEETIRFWHLDWSHKLISSSMSRHLSTTTFHRNPCIRFE